MTTTDPWGNGATVVEATSDGSGVNEDYWGLCPECHRSDGYINIGRGHWFHCREHKTRWCVGSNLFSTWQDETEDEQRAQYADMDFGSYRTVEPFTPARWLDRAADLRIAQENADERTTS